MFARVTMIEGPADTYDEAVRLIQEQAIPAAREIAGFVAGYWCMDRATGRGVVFAAYDSEESVRASEERARQLRDAVMASVGGQIVSVGTYEVIGQV